MTASLGEYTTEGRREKNDAMSVELWIRDLRDEMVCRSFNGNGMYYVFGIPSSCF